MNALRTAFVSVVIALFVASSIYGIAVSMHPKKTEVVVVGSAGHQLTTGSGVDLTGTVTGTLGAVNGGTGLDTSGFTGILGINNGTYYQAATTTGSTLSGTVTVNHGGTGATSLTSGDVLFGNGTSALSLTSNLFYDATNVRFAVGSSTPQRSLVASSTASIECNLTDGATITMDLRYCNQGRVTLGATGRDFEFSHESEALGQGIRLVICEDGTGSRTITTWDSSIRWAGGSAPTLTSTANHCDVLAGFTTAATGTPVILLDKSLNF